MSETRLSKNASVGDDDDVDNNASASVGGGSGDVIFLH